MLAEHRYLQIERIDLQEPDISSRCSQCGRQFYAAANLTEKLEDVLDRIRAQYEAHCVKECVDGIYEISKLLNKKPSQTRRAS